MIIKMLEDNNISYTLMAPTGRAAKVLSDYTLSLIHIWKEINIYGLWENYKDIQKAGYIVIFEAEKSVLKRDSRMDPTGGAIEGHVLSDEQVRIILGTGVEEVIIAMDNDVPIEEVWNMCEKFYGLRTVSYTHLDVYKRQPSSGLFLTYCRQTGAM